MIYADNAQVEIAGMAGRIICDRLRPAITEGADEHGAFVRFSVEQGDLSANEAKAYAGRLGSAPHRAMFTAEPEGNDPARIGSRLAINLAGMVIEPGPPIHENGVAGGKDGPHVTLWQYNVAPAKSGIADRPPVLEGGLVTLNHFDAKGRPLKDAKEKPLLFEHLEVKVRALVDGKAKVVHRVTSLKPIVRGQFISDIGIGFIDGAGVNPGLLEFWISGVLQAPKWRGVTGYPGYRSPYLGLGVYEHATQVPLAARFYGIREGIKA